MIKENPKVGDRFLCKRYFNAKRIIYVPCELIELGDNPTSPTYVTLKDLENGGTFKSFHLMPDDIKPIKKYWIENKIIKLNEERTNIDKQISNLAALL